MSGTSLASTLGWQGYSGCMGEPGEQPLRDRSGHAGGTRGMAGGRSWRPSSLGQALLLSAVAGVAAAVTWSILRVILELGPGSLVVAALGGWGIGASLRQANGSSMLGACVGGLAWLVGLILTWLLSMAVLPGSSRTFIERIAATPFLDWLAPQLGLLEAAALVIFVGFAAWSARPPNAAGR
jgi:hypothetical protein